ncbi:DKNYY domain-containing protein [Parvimonas sp. G1967]|uniref:DKNYY domain-containing protein n=1 Tax=Parvimonas sp. G1967 TaxID=3387695 RepID=UPI0039E33181
MDRKENESTRSKILGICLILFILAIAFFTFSQLLVRDDTYVNIERSGQRIGNSIFYKYDNKIYALIPSGGYYIVEDADMDSFSVINTGDTYHPSVVGIDKNHVYFGNVKIEDLNPKNISYIGNGYYTDGKSSYFCSPLSERNDEISYLSEGFGHIVHAFFKDKKPKSYIYPYHKVETEKKISNFKELLFFATDGDVLYYKGKVLKNADVNTITQVSKRGEYFCDKNNVYYKDELLPIKNSGELEVVSAEQGDDFLYDKKSGEVFKGNFRFDEKSVPYKVIGNKSSHIRNLFFISNDGVYFYNQRKNKQVKIGENNFKGNIKHLDDNVFCDEENIYFLSSYEKYLFARRFNRRRLYSINSQIVSFDKKEGWEKVKSINSNVIGSVWIKNGKYYYFDNLGNSQLIKDTVFEITDKEVLKELLSDENKITVNRIREIIKAEKMKAISGEVKYTATVKYRFYYLYMILCTPLIIIGSRIKWKRIKNNANER